MAVKSELWKYFMSHTSSRRSLKGSVQSFIGFTCNVDDELCDIILRRVRDSELSFNEAVRACFDATNKKLNFPYRLSVRNRETALHEMGHAVDFVKCETVKSRAGGKGEHETTIQLYHSTDHILSCGRTLDKILQSEMKEKADVIYGELVREFKEKVLVNFPEDVAERYFLNSERLIKDDTMKRKYRLPHFSRQEYITEREKIDKLRQRYTEMTLSYNDRYDMLKLRHTVLSTAEAMQFGLDNYTLSDVICRYKNVRYLWSCHSTSYLRMSGYFGVEFFANMFASLATKNEADLRKVERLLPKSYSAFFELIEHLKAVA